MSWKKSWKNLRLSIRRFIKILLLSFRTPHTDSQQRLHHYRGAKSTGSIVPDMNAEQVQTEARLRRGDNSNTEWMWVIVICCLPLLLGSWKFYYYRINSRIHFWITISHQQRAFVSLTLVFGVKWRRTPLAKNPCISTSWSQLFSTQNYSDNGVSRLRADDIVCVCVVC